MISEPPRPPHNSSPPTTIPAAAMTTIDTLPCELLTEILSHLPDAYLARTALVSRRMHDHSVPLLYRAPVLRYSGRTTLRPALKIFLWTVLTPGRESLTTHVRSLRAYWFCTKPCPSEDALLDPIASRFGCPLARRPTGITHPSPSAPARAHAHATGAILHVHENDARALPARCTPPLPNARARAAVTPRIHFPSRPDRKRYQPQDAGRASSAAAHPRHRRADRGPRSVLPPRDGNRAVRVVVVRYEAAYRGPEYGAAVPLARAPADARVDAFLVFHGAAAG